MYKTPEYKTWINIKTRCYNKNTLYYFNYGGRGISVCDRWKNSFLLFFSDMGKRPTSKHSIERKNNNGNYEPSNCFWATKVEQSHNNRIQRNSKTGIPGVRYNEKSEKFIVRITANWKEIHIGCYKTLGEAEISRKNAEDRYWNKNKLTNKERKAL